MHTPTQLEQNHALHVLLYVPVCWLSTCHATLVVVVQLHQFLGAQPSLWSNSHVHTWLLGKTMPLTIQTFIGKVTSLLFNTLSRLVITSLSRSKRLLILWLQSPSGYCLPGNFISPFCLTKFVFCHLERPAANGVFFCWCFEKVLSVFS